MKPTAFALISAILTLFPTILPADQGISGIIASLRTRYSADETRFRGALDELPDNPGSMEDGSLSNKLLSVSSDLQDLSKQAAQARSIILQKKRTLPPGLPQSDLEELNASLSAQQKPLEELDSEISALRSRIDDITSRRLAVWIQTYKSYADIRGEEAARAKLRGLVISDERDDSAKKKNRR